MQGIIVYSDPENIHNENELESVISKIDRFEKINGCSAGVVEIQNNMLGAIFKIIPREEAIKSIRNRKGSEWCVAYYPRSYFEEVKQFSR